MELPSHRGQVLVIEDDPDTRADLSDILKMDHHAVQSAGTLREALALEWLRGIDVILLDRRLSDGDALESFPRLRARAGGAAIVIVTAEADLEGAVEAIRHGAADYIVKPVNPDALRLRIGRLIEQQRLIRATERGETLFRNLVEAAESLIVVIRPNEQTILYFSPFAEQLTGHLASEVLGKSFPEHFLLADDRTALREYCRRTCAGNPQRGLQTRILCREGGTRTILCNLRCLTDYDGSSAILIVGHDITELKTAQERALQSERMAAIGQMCAGLAHESRNALQRSQACLEMLALQVRQNPQALNLIGRIQQAQDDLHRLYEDVREFAAPIKLVLRECRLDEIWRRAWSHLEPARRGRNAVLSDSCPEGASISLLCRADAFRLEQVFRNILDNALAATADSPVIQITATAVWHGSREAVRLSIRDNGPGLTPEQRGRIFEPFYTTKTRGTGLGMAIVKRIVEAHGGRVAVGETSGAGQGAEIILTLPRTPGE